MPDWTQVPSDPFAEQRIAGYRTARSLLVLAAGLNLDLYGQRRLGWRETHVGTP